MKMCETNGNTPTKITPSVTELCMVNNSISCPECSSTFSCSANRDLHLVKRHKLGSLPKKNLSVQFHCPAADCVYASQRHFATLKYVKQHYLKVHAVKSFICESCKVGFSTASALKRHTTICGRQFQCPCGLRYNSPEALATHMRRAGHRKFGNCNEDAAKGVRAMPPAPVILAAVALSELSFRPRRDNAVQTESTRQRGVTMAAQTESPRQRGAATQTARRISATTQTPPCGQRPIAPKDGVDEVVTGVMSRVTQTSRSPPTSRKRKSAQTQTNSPSKMRRQAPTLNHNSVPPLLSSSPPLDCNPQDLAQTPSLSLPLVHNLPNQTQALPPLGAAANEVEEFLSEGVELLDALWAGQLDCQTQTEPEPSLLEQLLDCETQTEGELDSLDGLYCHSTTQTCDHFLFPELGCCHDMHTQTDTR